MQFGRKPALLLCGLLVAGGASVALSHALYTPLSLASLFVAICGVWAYQYRQMRRQHCRLLERHTATEAALRTSEQRYRLLVDQTGAITYIAKLDAPDRLIYVSLHATSILGFAPDEWLDDPELWLRQVHPSDQAAVRAALACVTTSHQAAPREYRMLHRDGRVIWIHDEAAVVYDEARQALYLQGLLTDISEHKAAQQQLRHAVLHDSLTQLPNRTLFAEQLEHCMNAARQQAGAPSGAVLFIDLNNFRMVNDSLGHSTGDELLQAIGRRLRACVQPTDLVARFSGDGNHGDSRFHTRFLAPSSMRTIQPAMISSQLVALLPWIARTIVWNLPDLVLPRMNLIVKR